MPRFLLPLALLCFPTAIQAQDFGCPSDLNQVVFDLTTKAGAGEITAEDLSQKASDLVRGCGQDRAMLGQFVSMFTLAGLAIEPPDPGRFRVHLHAFRTSKGLAEVAPLSEPVTVVESDGSARLWGEIDERNAYWDLMFAMSGDFLSWGVYSSLYTPGKTEAVGCGLYPAEEASALSRHAEDNVDGGELLARISFLGRACDGDGHEVSGYAAQYFASHLAARQTQDDYLGLTSGDIHSGLRFFLERHLAGQPASDLFSADDVASLLAE